jgi:hypothetical protein
MQTTVSILLASLQAHLRFGAIGLDFTFGQGRNVTGTFVQNAFEEINALALRIGGKRSPAQFSLPLMPAAPSCE